MYADLDRLILDRLWARGDGKKMKVRRALQDAGGHYSPIVLAEAKRRYPRLMAYRGNATGQGLYRIVQNLSPVRTSVVTANVNLGKDLVAGLQGRECRPRVCAYPESGGRRRCPRL